MVIDAKRIKRILEERGITKAQISIRCGMSPSHICTVIQRRTCQPKTAGRLASGNEKFYSNEKMSRREMLQNERKNRGENVILENRKDLKNKGYEFPGTHNYTRRESI